MTDKLAEKIKFIMEKSNSDKITVFTEHLKIDGTVYDCPKCNNEHFLNLTDVLVCRLKDYCTCDSDECECNDYICFKYDWLHVNIGRITAFSFRKSDI